MSVWFVLSSPDRSRRSDQSEPRPCLQEVKDPLEEYCETAPDADECRVYED